MEGEVTYIHSHHPLEKSMYLRSVNNKTQTYDAIYHKGVAGNAKGFP